MERDCTELPQSQLMQGLPGHGGDWTFTLSEGKSNCRSLRQRAVWSDLALKSTTRKTRTQVLTIWRLSNFLLLLHQIICGFRA